MQKQTNINRVLKKTPSGTVVTAGRLKSLGVGSPLVQKYVQGGWLSRVSNGAYTRLNEKADLNGAIYALQEDGLHIHQGGQSALANIYGKLQYVRGYSPVHLFAPRGTNLPKWFVKAYGGQYRLFLTDFLPPEMGLAERKVGDFALKESSLERALLELCYMVPKPVSAQEAFEITETIQVLKPDLLQKLLESCSQVKVNRLVLCFGELAYTQWREVLDETNIDLGHGKREIDVGGTLFKKYGLVMKVER